jgi:hypothetical protein
VERDGLEKEVEEVGVMKLRGKDQLATAIEEVAKIEPSLPDDFKQMPVYAHDRTSAQNNNTSSRTQYNNNSTGNQNNGPGQQYIGEGWWADIIASMKPDHNEPDASL